MMPRELLSDLRARGVELRLAEDCRHVLHRGASAEEIERIRAEKVWLVMCLAHEAGADLYDPRLCFLVGADRGLTRGAICDRMRIALGIGDELAQALIELAESAGYLRQRGPVLEPVGDVSAVLARERELLPALVVVVGWKLGRSLGQAVTEAAEKPRAPVPPRAGMAGLN